MTEDQFRTYPSIEDFYEDPDENRDQYEWTIMNKLDGSNVTFYFEPGRKCRLGSREQLLGGWDTIDWQRGLFDAIEHEPRLKEFVDYWENRSAMDGKTYHLYGELVGPKINARVWYGPHHSVRFFDIRIGRHIMPVKDFLFEMKLAGFADMVVPIFAQRASYEDAVHFNIAIPDPVAVPKKPLKRNPENITEGVVLKPWDRHMLNKYGRRTILRRKNPMFNEKPVSKDRKSQKPQPTKAAADKAALFLSYLNEARMLSCFSKMGPIEDAAKLGDYIRAMLVDMEKDFQKDGNSWTDADERKLATKRANGPIVKALQAELKARESASPISMG